MSNRKIAAALGISVRHVRRLRAAGDTRLTNLDISGIDISRQKNAGRRANSARYDAARYDAARYATLEYKTSNRERMRNVMRRLRATDPRYRAMQDRANRLRSAPLRARKFFATLFTMQSLQTYAKQNAA